ncbi:hypothetical protein [Sphingomonas sp. TDK1]|uniref:hypothetical protein n=1 Tax=Sphingomonas sp. TDK1 TaxID=453247 RepID=UPI0007D919DE|nr:hypothetical protein [Sphingomonas sp. TDK1]OAN65430.1 hypothetical protein A7X12_15890 [Sphingomonas sp. TDK1]
MTPEPNAALIDAGALVAALFAVRLALLWRSDGTGWRGWAARWLRRGIWAALLVPALRLGTLAGAGGERAPLMIAAMIALLATGALLALVDTMLAEALATPRRR